MHSPQIVVELRELPPEDGWACAESTGRACFICTCGTTTGFVDRAEAIQAATEHPDARTDADRAEWLTRREPLKVDVRLVGLGPDVVSFVRRLLRRG